jgi:hypothetical protein
LSNVSETAKKDGNAHKNPLMANPLMKTVVNQKILPVQFDLCRLMTAS